MISPIGYDFNDGGISNQKLTLIGLLFEASKLDAGKRLVYLPNIWSRDQGNINSSVHEISDIFWIDQIEAFCRRWGIELTERPREFPSDDRILRGGWTYFGIGTRCVRESATPRSSAATSFAADFFRSLVPKVTSSVIFQSVCQEIFHRRNITVVSQFRIEDDWQKYARTRLAKAITEDEDYCIDADRIVAKIKTSLSEFGNMIFASCDERYLPAPKTEIANKVKMGTGIDVVWKSDIINSYQFDSLTPLEASLIDFEITKIANTFVGMTRSTFANLACFERFAMRYQDTRRDYIYNLPGEALGQRLDLGGHSHPGRAVR